MLEKPDPCSQNVLQNGTGKNSAIWDQKAATYPTLIMGLGSQIPSFHTYKQERVALQERKEAILLQAKASFR